MVTDRADVAVHEPAGLLWTWWRGDALPSLARLPDLIITTTTDYAMLAALSETDLAEVLERVVSQHQPYVACLAATPVAYGWSAAGQTSFGSPAVVITVPTANRYLLDFATLPAWRGRGIYPHMLQAILTQERGEADRFWVLHQASNHASARGIAKAGFRHVAEIYFLQRGGLGLLATGAVERARAGAELLGLPLVN